MSWKLARRTCEVKEMFCIHETNYSLFVCWWTVNFTVREDHHRSTVNFQMFKLDLEKVEEPEIKLPTSAVSSKKQESSRKTSISALLTMPRPLTVWITINCGKFLKRWEYQATWPSSWETYMCWGPAQVDPGNLKQGRRQRGSGNNCLIKR